MSAVQRSAAASLVVGALAGLISVLIEPTISDDAAKQASAVTAHATALSAGLAVNSAAAVLAAAGLVWLAWTTYERAPRLATVGGVLGVLGLFAVMLDDGLLLAGSAVANGVGTDQATVLLGRIFSGGLSAVGVISVLSDIGVLLLGIAVARIRVPRWGSTAIVAGAIVRAIGFGPSGSHYVAAVGSALLVIGFATVVRTVSASAPAPTPAVVATTAA